MCNSLAKTILFTHKSARNFTLSEFRVVVWVDKWRGIFGKYFLIIRKVHGSENIILSAQQSAIFSVIDSKIWISLFLGKMFIVRKALVHCEWSWFIVFFRSSKL